jgi:hypothetical protein
MGVPVFTLPDTADAAATCPPIGAVGPKPNGFFADCDPAANFDGTRPIAEHFNELIVNLRALLAHASIAAVKGDPTMLWRAIQAMILSFTIDAAVTVNVAPGGSANPANPLGGDPFDTLVSALNWLAYYSITPRGYVTIQLAAATYTHTASILCEHPNGDRITIAGADAATTVLSFPSGTNGLTVTTNLNGITTLTIQGNKTSGTLGVAVTGLLRAYELTVKSWDVGVQVEGGGYLEFQALDVSDTVGNGLALLNRGACNGSVFTATQIGFGIGAPYYIAGLACNGGGVAWIDQITCTNCHKGLDISGAGSEVRARRIQVHGVDPIPDGSGGTTSIAVEANDGAVIVANGGNPGDWHADMPAYFWAAMFAFIRADNAFDNWAHTHASPSPQTLGNVNAMVWTTSLTPPSV